MLKRVIAFTLAEVLITLAIIGVVAALTIPTLVSNYQKTQYVTQLKKAYSQFNQALVQMAADRGCVGDLKCTGLFVPDANVFGSEFVEYFKVVKNCDTTGSGCMSTSVDTNYDGSSSYGRFSTDTIGHYRFISADGVAFSITTNLGTANCNAKPLSSAYMMQYCGDLEIDVNGPTKGPNYRGRDIFMFSITNGKGPLLYPEGDDDQPPWQRLGSSCSPGDKFGNFCAARIMQEGWQMNY